MRSAERTRLPVRQRAAQSSEVAVLGWQRPWACAKRPEKGGFRWPETTGEETLVVLSHEELALLPDGTALADGQL